MKVHRHQNISQISWCPATEYWKYYVALWLIYSVIITQNKQTVNFYLPALTTVGRRSFLYSQLNKSKLRTSDTPIILGVALNSVRRK